jgi:rubrerythrin
MAKKQNRDLMRVLDAGGVRKRVARVLTEATGSSKRDQQPKLVTKTIDNLKTAAGELDTRVRGSRSEAAKKAARTRKRNAAKRSAAARKGAKTRARSRS